MGWVSEAVGELITDLDSVWVSECAVTARKSWECPAGPGPGGADE